MENHEAGADRQRPQLLGFVPGRDEEVAATRLVERLRGFAGAEAIAVGLDRRSGRHAGAVLQPAPIVLKRGAVDGQAQRAMHVPSP